MAGGTAAPAYLSVHGAAVLADRRADAAAETAYERGLRQGAGRRVL